MFFCNSGAEANEGLFKLARKFGHDEGRFEIITTIDSFHGRTLAGIAATGQEKVKKGFEPAVDGFKQVPLNDLEAMRRAISPKTAAILVEPYLPSRKQDETREAHPSPGPSPPTPGPQEIRHG